MENQKQNYQTPKQSELDQNMLQQYKKRQMLYFIRNLMEAKKIEEKEAIKLLGIPKKERPEYLRLLAWGPRRVQQPQMPTDVRRTVRLELARVSVRNLMKNLDISPEEAADLLQLDPKDRKSCLTIIHNQLAAQELARQKKAQAAEAQDCTNCK